MKRRLMLLSGLTLAVLTAVVWWRLDFRCREWSEAEHLLYRALVAGDYCSLEDALVRGANPNAVDWDDPYRTPVFILSVKSIELVEMMVARGANVNISSRTGHTALMQAAYEDRPDVVALLMSMGANAEAKNVRGMTALDMAEDLSHSNVVKIIRGM